MPAGSKEFDRRMEIKTDGLPHTRAPTQAVQGAEPGEKLQVQVIARAASILRALENQPAGLSLAEIAAASGLARSTVQRIAAALQAEQLLIAASPNAKLRLGPALRRLAASVETDTLSLARPVLQRLSQDLGETVDLAAVKGRMMVFIDQIVGTQRLRTVAAVGETFPMHCTANGKAYLATLPDAQIKRLIGAQYARRTGNTFLTLDRLLADLATVRRTGIAFDQEEHADGISAAGVCLTDTTGMPVAISVPVPTSRFNRRRKAVAEALLEARRTLQARFAGAA
jgi:DNA-binding IclR family transcriptional regulator